MIYFKQNLTTQALSMIKEQKELSDVLNDLSRIDQAKNEFYTHAGLQQARNLDAEMRKKYPMIDLMLNTANRFKLNFPANTKRPAMNEPEELTNLQQDRYGIICDTLLKKGITSSVEEYIDHID